MIPAIVNTMVVPPVLALLVSSTAVALLIHSRVALLAIDHPNQRSLHERPTPRLGGIGVVLGIAAAWCYASPGVDPWLLAALGLLIGISLLDDLKGVGVAWRMAVHLTSAALAVVSMLPEQALWLIALAVVATAWMTNLYNFMDGADGLAGGMTVIGFGGYGVAAFNGGDFAFAAINLSVAAAALGFLLFNFPPARIFMGDVGAIPLGCLAAVFNMAGWLRGDWPWWFGMVIFSPFVVDASLTLMKRALRGDKIWQAHREHYYQRLVRSGWGHRNTAYAEYTLMLACGVIAIVGMHQERHLQFVILGAVALLYSSLAFAMEKYFARHA